MSFLHPIILWALPLALLPILIHLINQHRHKSIKWAAMMFLNDAKRMTKGMARLKQILILALRALAVLALIFVATRPLAGGFLSMSMGSRADTILLLVDRSASMSYENIQTGESKLLTGLQKITDSLQTTGRRNEVILIDSATREPIRVTDLSVLLELPQTAPTNTVSDIPSLLQSGLDFLIESDSGKSEIWLLSDSRETDWKSTDARWEGIRSTFAQLDRTEFFLLNYPESDQINYGITVTSAKKQTRAGKTELVLDFTLLRSALSDQKETISV
ncbi:MAG: BatA domain-containing protein, partial [Verrucomicrobiota bacterium]